MFLERDELIEKYRVSPFLSREHWTYTTQGLTSDGTDWYVSNTRHIFKLGDNLRGDPIAVTGADTDTAFWQGEYKHISAIDYWAAKDLIVGAVEHDNGDVGKAKPGYIAVWDRDLRLVAKAQMISETLQNDAPWCAVNPVDQLIYVSKCRPDIAPLTVESFKPVFDGRNLTLIPCGERRLYAANGEVILGSDIQAGCFSPDGQLYLALESFGVMRFDMNTGRRTASIPIPLKRNIDGWWEYISGYFSPGSATEEFEGITFRGDSVYVMKSFYAGFASVLRYTEVDIGGW